jgi:hypothetical protein
MPRPLYSHTLNLRLTDSGSHRQTLVAATTINPAPVVFLTSAAPITMSSTPTLADGFDGQQCILVVTGANAITFTDQGTLAGSNLRLSVATIALGTRDSLQLLFSGDIGDWVELSTMNVI